MEERVTIDGMITMIEDMRVDYMKTFMKGNKAAATRLRKKYQELIKVCKEGRIQALDEVKKDK